MIAILTFPFLAAALVLLAGRKDAARDPKLTFLLLTLLAILPILVAAMPKLGLLPTSSTLAATSRFPWMEIGIALWAIGFIFALGRIFIAGIVIARWRKTSVEIAVREGVSIRSYSELRSPVAAGIFRKTVFVPADWNRFPEAQREIVLAHEFAHHRRQDPLWRICIELVRAVYWWNPIVFWMARRYVMQSECACDESVLRHGTDPKFYAKVLCDFAETHSTNSFAVAMADTSFLERRVGRILARENQSGFLLATVLGILGISAACGLSMLGGEQMVAPSEVEMRFSAKPFPGEL